MSKFTQRAFTAKDAKNAREVQFQNSGATQDFASVRVLQLFQGASVGFPLLVLAFPWRPLRPWR